MFRSGLKISLLIFIIAAANCINHTVAIGSNGNVVAAHSDEEIFNRYIAKFGSVAEQEMGTLVTSTALHFLGFPYVAHTLESRSEKLTINLSQFDCATFLESVIALARTVKSHTQSFEQYQKELKELRYRSDKIERWSDRIHYSSEWIHHNSTLGKLTPLKVEGVTDPIKFKLSFISNNPKSYKALERDPSLIKDIVESEIKASKYQHHYISTAKLERVLTENSQQRLKELFKSGDVVAFVTSIAGLDITHVGFLYWQGDKLTFIHASSREKMVAIEKLSLLEYLKRGRANRGVIITTPKYLVQ